MDVRKKSQKQEKQVAKDLEGKVTIASGALYFQKADVRTDKYLVECKTTSTDTFQIKRSLLEKIRDEALRDGMRIPLFVIEFLDGKTSVVIMQYNDFLANDKIQDEGVKKISHDIRLKKCCGLKYDMFLDIEDYIKDKDVYIPRIDILYAPINNRGITATSRHWVMLPYDQVVDLL